MDKTSLGDRMKNNYENISRYYLTHRLPVIIRIDGKSFHTFTKDKKWEVDFDEAGNILARTRHGKPYYFKGHINDKVNDFPSTDEDNIILEIDNEGNRKVRFRPTVASETPKAMEQLILAYLDARDNSNINKLLLIEIVRR